MVGIRRDHSVEFRVLGTMEVSDHRGLVNIGPRMPRAILAALLMNANRVVPLDHLIDDLWGERPPAAAAATMHVYISNLRRALEPDRSRGTPPRMLVSQAPGYMLRVDPLDVDAGRFEALVGEGRSLLCNSRDLSAARDALRSALALWRGQPYADLAFEPFIQLEVTRLTELHKSASEALMEGELALGEHASAVGSLQRLVAEEPLREWRWELLVLALYRCGRQAEALRALAEARRLLSEDLGLDLGAALRRMEGDILRQDPSLDWQPPGKPAAVETSANHHEPPSERSEERQRVLVGWDHEVAQVPRQLPAHTPHFVGRTEELLQLTSLLENARRDPGTVVISAIGGSPGIGKTTLAVHWAHRVADRFPDGQLYVNLRGFDPTGIPMQPAEAIRGFLDAFDIPAKGIPANPNAQIALYRTLLTDRKVLVLLDNAHDAEQVRPLLPASSTCMALITTRNQLTSLTVQEGAHLINLDVLSPEEARALLTSRFGHDRVAAEPEVTAELIELCGSLPLALAIVAARAAMNPSFPLRVWAEELRSERRLDALDAEELDISLRALFSWSCRSLTPAASRLFRLLGLHPGPDISLDAAASLATISTSEAQALLTELTRTHLLDEHTPRRFRLHDLLRLYAAERAEAEETEENRDAAVRRVLIWYLHTADAAHRVLLPQLPPVPLDSMDALNPQLVFETYGQATEWYETERANLIAAIRHAGEIGHYSIAWKLPISLLGFFNLRNAWTDLLMTYNIGLNAVHHLHDYYGEAWITASLGHAHRELGRFQESAGYSEKSLTICRNIGFRWGEGAALYNLGGALRGLRRFEEAQDCFQQAMDIFRQTDNRQGEGRNLTALGAAHLELGRLEDALHCHQKALTIYREIGDRQGEGVALDDLGTAYQELRRSEDALGCFRLAHAVHIETGNQEGAAESLCRMGEVLHIGSQLETARECWTQALAIFKELSHPRVASIRAHLNILAAEPAA